MKNKKKIKNKVRLNNEQGFTLMEILAVIVIIGILLMIVVLPISRYIINSKNTTYESYKEDLKVSATNYMINCISGDEKSCVIPEVGKDIKLTYDILVDKGYSEELKSPEGEGFCDKSYVIIKRNDKSDMNLDYKVCLFCDNYENKNEDCVLDDENGEVITPEEPGNIPFAGIAYMGYEIDAKNKSVYESILTIEGLKKYNNIEGIVVYFKDAVSSLNVDITSKGNDVEENKTLLEGGKQIVLKVYENTYSELSIEFNSVSIINKIEKIQVLKKENTTSIWTNKDIGLYIENTDDEQKKYSFDNGESYVSIPIKNFSSNIEGQIVLKDSSDNISNAYSYTIDKIDKEEPICELSGSGTEGDNGWYTSNVEIFFSKHLDSGSGVKSYGISGVNGGKTSTLTTDTSNKEYKGYIEDNAGNTNTCTVKVKKDATKPTCTLTSSGTKGDNNWYTSDVTISFSEHSDATSGVKSYSVDGVKTTTLKTDTKSKTYTGYIKDDAGNANTCSVIVKKDATPPSCTLTSSGTKGTNDWYRSDVEISFSDHSDITSGVKSYSIDGAKTTTLTTDTANKLYTGYIEDNAGNTNTCDLNVKRDTVYPTITPLGFTYVEGSSWSNLFSLTAYDANGYPTGTYVHCYKYIYNKEGIGHCDRVLPDITDSSPFSALTGTNAMPISEITDNYTTSKFQASFGYNGQKITDLYYRTKICDGAGNCICNKFTFGWEARARTSSDYTYSYINISC